MGFLGLGRSPDLDADLPPLDAAPFAGAPLEDFVGAIVFVLCIEYAEAASWRVENFQPTFGRIQGCQDFGERALGGEQRHGSNVQVPDSRLPTACSIARDSSDGLYHTQPRRPPQLPIAMSSERVFRLPFRKPQWMNSATTRTAGVYFAGALVHPTCALLPARAIADMDATVCHRPLRLH